MTIEEKKAKAYDEALERARKLYERGTITESLGYVFPELAESEDEKVRNLLISLVENWKVYNPNSPFVDYPIYESDKEICDKILAWLEKQKEYESTDFEYVWDRTDCGELTSALDKYSEEAIINMCHAWYDKGIELERKSWLEKQGRKKHALSEEDEEHIDSLLKRLDGLCRNEFERTRFAISEDEDWLKSLKQRIGG